MENIVYHNLCAPVHHVASYEMAKAFVDAEIQKPVVVFSKSYCPFCKMAKNVLSEIGVQYALYELDERGRWSFLLLWWVSALYSCASDV